MNQYPEPGPSPAIHASALTKTFRVPERESGLLAAAGSLFHRRFRDVHAVDGVSFEIAPGEIVGFLGPNGAGKTTAIKMMAGLVHPTSGSVEVLGFRPAAREKAYLRRMALVMGNRHQLAWDLPALDSFELFKALYSIPPERFLVMRDSLIEMLDLGQIVRKPVRNLSLGERMKVEIAGALLHSPDILFLDEPTIGLDVTMQRRIRAFIADYNARFGATVLLTSHYMADIEALCRRVIVIHHGRLLFDGALSDLVARMAPHKRLTVTLEVGASVPDEAIERITPLTARRDGTLTLDVPKAEVARVATRLLAELPVADLAIEEADVEDVIERVFSSESAE